MKYFHTVVQSLVFFERKQVFLKSTIFFIINNCILTKAITFSEITSKIKIML